MKWHKIIIETEVIKGFIPQATKITLGKVLNMFLILDALKNMKACLNNDFSFWKRAYGFLQQGAKNVDPASMMEVDDGAWRYIDSAVHCKLPFVHTGPRKRNLPEIFRAGGETNKLRKNTKSRKHNLNNFKIYQI